MSDILVVYYSRSGKTRWVAEQIARTLGADLEEIREQKDRSGALGWLSGGRDAMKKTPAELVSTHTTEGKRIVIVGMPVWAFQPPTAVRAYLSKADLAGRKVCAFCTFDGSGDERTLAETGKLVPGGLAGSASFKKVKPDDPALVERVANWCAEIAKI